LADITKTIEIIFGAVDDTGNALGSVSNNINSATDSIGNITSPLANVTEGLLKTEAAVLALAAAYGGFALSEAIKFQDAQIDLAKVLGETDPAIESFTDTVIELSEQYGIASGSILQGIANFKQAGFTAIESAKLQKDALDLVIAGDVQAAQASEILIASLKGFGAGADDATRFIEALNNVSNTYATDLGELAVGMARISPIAEKMGFSFEEATGLITPIIEVFRSGPEAANALRTGLLKLIDDAAPVGEALEKIGVAQSDANGVMRSGKDIFLDVATAFKTLDENQKLVLTSQLVGTEQAAKMVVVFDNLAKVQAITNEAMKETGSVTEEVALRLESASKQIDIAVQSFNNLAKSVGDELLPAFGDIAGGTTEIIQAFRDIVNSGGLAPLFDALDEQGKDFAIFLSDIAKALPEAFEDLDFSKLIRSFDTLKDAIGGLFGDLDLTTAEGLEEALQNLIDFVTLLTNASAGAVEGLEPLVNGVVAFLEALADSDSDTQNFLGFIGGTATAIDKLLPLLGFLADALGVVGGALGVIAGLKAADLFKKISFSLTGISPTNVALAGAIGAVTFAINENAKAYDDLQSRNAIMDEALKDRAFSTGKLAEGFKQLSEETGVLITSSDEFNKAIDDGRIVFDEAVGSYVAGGEAISDYDKAANEALETQLFWIDAVDEAGQAFGDNVEAVKELSEEQKQLLDFNKQFPAVIEETNKALESSVEATDDLAEAERVAVEQTNKLEIQLNDLASNEKIAAMEFTANIKVAEFEADAQKFSAIVEGMTADLVSNNELVADLFSHDAPDWDRFGFDTQRAIDAANDRAEEAHDSLLSLQEAQVENLEAKTQSLLQGDAQITINADGLQPELQALLKSLLEFIQIEANAEGLELLL